MTTEKIHFEVVQNENRAEIADNGVTFLPAWCVRREAEAFRDLLRAVAFKETGKDPGKDPGNILFSWES